VFQDITNVFDWITNVGAIGAIGAEAHNTEIVYEYSLNPKEF